MQQFALFVKLNKWKEEKNPISKLEQFFFQIEQMKRRENSTNIRLKNVREKKCYRIQSLSKLLVLLFIEWNCAIQNKIKSKNR